MMAGSAGAAKMARFFWAWGGPLGNTLSTRSAILAGSSSTFRQRNGSAGLAWVTWPDIGMSTEKTSMREAS